MNTEAVAFVPGAGTAGLPGPVALTRIHSITKHSVSMRDADVDLVVQSVESLLDNDFARSVPQLAQYGDGWLPIASLLNYSPLGQTVWPFGGVGVVADCLRARASVKAELSGGSTSVVSKVAIQTKLT